MFLAESEVVMESLPITMGEGGGGKQRPRTKIRTNENIMKPISVMPLSQYNLPSYKEGKLNLCFVKRGWRLSCGI